MGLPPLCRPTLFSALTFPQMPRSLSPTFCSINTSKNLFSCLKDLIPQTEKSGVYSIQCDCPAVYVSQAGRCLKSPISEHSNAVSKNNPDISTFAAHILSSGHSFNVSSSVSLLNSAPRGRRCAQEFFPLIKTSAIILFPRHLRSLILRNYLSYSYVERLVFFFCISSLMMIF